MLKSIKSYFKTVSRTQYFRQGGYYQDMGDMEILTVAVAPLIIHNKKLLTPEAGTLPQLRLQPIRKVTYRLIQDLSDKSYIEVVAPVVRNIHTLLVILSSYRPATNVAAGVSIASIGPGQRLPYQEGVYRVLINPQAWPSHSYITLFLSNPEDGTWFKLAPEAVWSA